MRNAVIILGLLGGVTAIMFLVWDPSLKAEEEKTPVDQSLLARVEALEELISLHTHDRELRGISERLQALEAVQTNDSSVPKLVEPIRQAPSQQLTADLSKLKQEVQSLSSKLANLERSVSPLKQDISKLKLSVMRVESSVARIDLRR